jgi:hypothetical protein
MDEGDVKKFRAYYKLDRPTVSRKASPPVSDPLSDSRIRIPNPNPIPDPEPNPTPEKESARGNTATLSLPGSNRSTNGNTTATTLLRERDEVGTRP